MERSKKRTLLQIFNGPRAHINLNDNFGGGDTISHNLLVNAVR